MESYNFSGVFSTGAKGAIAPAILRKRQIAPAILKFQHSEKRLRELANNFTD